MRTISKETSEKIHRLGCRTFWSRVFAETDERVELLREIGFSGEAAVIPEIAWLLVDASGPLWRAAAEAVHRLLDSLAPLDMAALDQHVRDVGGYDRDVDRRWRKLRPSDLSRFGSSEFAVSLLGLASFHSSGYVREAAVEHLAAQDNGHELLFLLIRLNDWVEPVREAAAKAVNSRVRPEYAPHFLRNIRLVLSTAIVRSRQSSFGGRCLWIASAGGMQGSPAGRHEVHRSGLAPCELPVGRRR